MQPYLQLLSLCHLLERISFGDTSLLPVSTSGIELANLGLQHEDPLGHFTLQLSLQLSNHSRTEEHLRESNSMVIPTDLQIFDHRPKTLAHHKYLQPNSYGTHLEASLESWWAMELGVSSMNRRWNSL